MNKALSKITIIMPTFNRTAFALRNMRLWSDKGPTMHVLDGSSNKIDNSNLENMGNNIFYHHIPEDYFTRLLIAKDFIKTKYSIMQCDDEIFMPSALTKCVEFLDNNNSFSSCIGRAIAFKIENKEIVVAEKFSPIKKSEIRSSSYKIRVLSKALHYLPSTYYSLTRSEVFISNLKIMNIKSSSPYTGEVLVEFSNSFHGGSKILDNLMWLRSYENDPIHNESWNRNEEIDLWYNDNNKKDEIQKCINQFTEIVFGSSGIPKVLIKEYTIIGFNIICGINLNFISSFPLLQ